MLYVREITDLMAAFPGRDFKMAEIVRYVAGAGAGWNGKQSVPCSAPYSVRCGP
jgi:hypothetical protein